MMGMRQIIHDFTIIWRAMKTVILCTKVIELTQNNFTTILNCIFNYGYGEMICEKDEQDYRTRSSFVHIY